MPPTMSEQDKEFDALPWQMIQPGLNPLSLESSEYSNPSTVRTPPTISPPSGPGACALVELDDNGNNQLRYFDHDLSTSQYTFPLNCTNDGPIGNLSGFDGGIYRRDGNWPQLQGSDLWTGWTEIQHPDDLEMEEADGRCGEAPSGGEFTCTWSNCNRTFKRRADAVRHIKTHSKHESVWRCGLCVDDPLSDHDYDVYQSKRRDHVYAHIKGPHKSQYCQWCDCRDAACAPEGTVLGLIFDSPESLQHHNAQKHATNKRRADRSSFSCTTKRLKAIEHKNGFNEEFKTLCDATSPVNYEDSHPSKLPEQPMLPVDDSEANLPAFEKMKEEEIAGVNPAEFVSLSQEENVLKHQWREEVCIRESHVPMSEYDEKMHCDVLFDVPRQSIQLRGPQSLVTNLKTIIEGTLERFRRYSSKYQPTSPVNVGEDNLVQPRASARLKQSPQDIKLFPIREEQDSPLLLLWEECLMPALPAILKKWLGSTFSAVLLREGESEQASSPVIKIRSPFTKNRRVTQRIRQEIRGLCRNNGASVQTSFSDGRTTLLAAHGESEESYSDNEEGDEYDLDDFPHHKRWWKRVGMGASIGLRCNKTVTASSGGYVCVDNTTLLLTTDHFVENARVNSSTAPSEFEVISPSIRDIHYVRQRLSVTIQGIEEEINLLLREEKGHHVSLDEAAGFISGNKPLHDLHQKLRAYYKDLCRQENEFIIGKVKYRRGSDRRLVECDRPHKHRNCPSYYRRMDWALCSIDETRKGENRHRHIYDAQTLQPVEIAEEQFPRGQGKPCLETGPIRPGARVEYVGAGTGHQKGYINGARAIECNDGLETVEWCIVPDNPSQSHGGDSGAWIIQSDDNKLVGMLWGEDDVLIFTPIDHIFSDIMEEHNTEQVCLPRNYPPGPGVGRVRQISHIEEQPIETKGFSIRKKKRGKRRNSTKIPPVLPMAPNQPPIAIPDIQCTRLQREMESSFLSQTPPASPAPTLVRSASQRSDSDWSLPESPASSPSAEAKGEIAMVEIEKEGYPDLLSPPLTAQKAIPALHNAFLGLTLK